MQASPIRILLIDDEEIEFIRIKRLLKKSDLNCDLVWSQESLAGLEKYKTNDYDICLMDYHIDQHDGIEIMHSYREQGGQKPIVILTGMEDPDIDARALSLGANDYLIKDDLSVSGLSRSIRYALKNAELMAQLRKANLRFKVDLEAASELQHALLPERESPFVDYPIAWRYKPSVNVAGDLFNYFEINAEHIGVYIIDVSGHGVPAAMFAVQLSRIVMPGVNYGRDTCRICPADFMNPASLLGKLNVLFPMRKPDFKYFTIIYAVIERETGKTVYSTAGAPPPLISNPAGEIRHAEGTGVPIGLMPETRYDNFELILRPSERMLLYSDGINESFNEGREMFGKLRIQDSLSVYAVNNNTQCEHLMDALSNWSDPDLEQDDCTLVLVERSK